MSSEKPEQKQRKRAPSKRSLETKARILDAAERVFAERGFDGASIRDIASEAGTQVGLVHHHGGGKDELFHQTVARRAQDLAERRMQALEARRTQGPLSVEAIVTCFFAPYLERARNGGAQWLAYARLVAWVSADPRWRPIAAECFDPTARHFVKEIAALFPDTDPRGAAAGFVYSVAALLAHLTSAWRIGALSDGDEAVEKELETLVAFATAGIRATILQAIPDPRPPVT